MPAQRVANGGLGSVQFPNYAGLNRARTWRTRDNASSPTPWIYATERHSLSGLGISPAQYYGTRRYTEAPRYRERLQPDPLRRHADYFLAAANRNESAPAPTYRRAYPWHGAAPAGTAQPGSFVTSSPETGSIVSYQPNTGTPIYPYGQQPASSSAAATAVAPSSSTIIGYDANGNPVYQGQTVSSAGLPIASATPPAAAGTSWFSQDSLGLGLSNGVYAAIGVGLVLMLKKK